MVDWPGDLPKRPTLGGWQVQQFDPAVRNTPERGPPMVRRRASIDFAMFSGTLTLTQNQLNSLMVFWRSTTSYGSAVFNMAHWYDLNDQVQVVFAQAPGPVQQIANGFYSVPVSFAQVP